MPDQLPGNELTITPAARIFVVTATGASLAAFNLGFDLGAFENIDHRKIWAIWVLCTVALIASYLFRDHDYQLGGRWRLALAVPSLWLVADFSSTSGNEAIVFTLLVASLVALPFGLYVLARLVAGDFFVLPRRLQVALAVTALFVFSVGWYVGSGHERFLTCTDFELAGEHTPDNCRP